VFDSSREAKAQAFKEAAQLLQIYPKGADDEVFVTFYLTDAQATLYSFADAPKISRCSSEKNSRVRSSR
jgi:uncharacterized pyridoxamine 5'-phosphate oxidase family protein